MVNDNLVEEDEEEAGEGKYYLDKRNLVLLKMVEAVVAEIEVVVEIEMSLLEIQY